MADAPDKLSELLRDPLPLERAAPALVDQVLRALGDVPTADAAYHSDKPSAPPVSAEPPMPAHFGKLKVLREIGRGGMGVVLEAEDAGLGRRVAIKVMAPNVATRPGARERFEREARAAAAVRHDHIVEIYEVGEQGGLPYFVMPLLPGAPLSARLMGGALLPEEVIRIGREIATGLAAAHAAGLVHRDIKPANLWLEAPNGRVKILDFGLARLASGADRHTDTGAVLGTADYMSPEQADGLIINHRSDLFSLGAVVYHMATGVKPFPGTTTPVVLQAVAKHKPPKARDVNPSVPPELSALIGLLIEKRPEHRPPSAAWVVDALDAISAGAPVPPLPRRSSWSRRKLLAGLALAVVVGAIGIGLWLAFGEKKPAPDYRGNVDVLVNRNSRWVPLISVDALPVKNGDHIKVAVQLDQPAYLYVFWVEPDGEVFPLHPWSKIAWGTRPKKETPVAAINLPESQDYTIDPDKPQVGVTTMVAFASPEPLKVSDEDFQKWFRDLPKLKRDPKDERDMVWFENFTVPRDPKQRVRLVESIDPYERWQAELKKRVGGAAPYQMSISFAQGDRK